MNQYSKRENLDELKWAIDSNPGEINFNDVEDLISCLEGENDGYSWHWIVKLKNGKYGYLTGGCDYTGWDCQSSLDHHITNSLEDAFNLVPEIDGDARDARKHLIDHSSPARESEE